MLRRSLLVAFLTLSLAGCETAILGSVAASCALRTEPTLLPETLPAGQVGELYHVALEVIDTPAPVHGIYVSDAQPLPEGLRIEHQDRDNHGFIVGTPIRAGTYEVHLSAGTYGTQCTGLRARRIYTLYITE